MKNIWNKFSRNQSGAAFIEASMVMIFLVIAFVGLMEVMSFIMAKNKMNTVAGNTANLLATMDEYVAGTGENAPIMVHLRAARKMAEPYGVTVSARFCEGAIGFESPEYKRQYAGSCGRTSGSGMVDYVARCDDAKLGTSNLDTSLPTMQFVTVSAACNYQPIVTLFDLFMPDMLRTQVAVPIRKTMIW